MGPFGRGTNFCAFSVPKYGWASSRNTPEPHTATKLLHKRDYRISSKSPAADAIKIDSPAGDTPTMEPPRSTTPCPRSFTPTSQPKMPNKRELPVKVAEILTQTGCQSRPTNLSRETYVIMKKALQGTQRAGQTRNDVRGSKQRVWKYVTNLSSNGRASVTPTGKIIDPYHSVAMLSLGGIRSFVFARQASARREFSARLAVQKQSFLFS